MLNVVMFFYWMFCCPKMSKTSVSVALIWISFLFIHFIFIYTYIVENWTCHHVTASSFSLLRQRKTCVLIWCMTQDGTHSPMAEHGGGLLSLSAFDGASVKKIDKWGNGHVAASEMFVPHALLTPRSLVSNGCVVSQGGSGNTGTGEKQQV